MSQSTKSAPQFQGKLISFEGGEGAGKSSQIQKLREHLEGKDIEVVTTREPGGTEGGEKVRRILKDGDKGLWDGLSEALLLYASRHDLVEKVIRPALKKGVWVLADRFADSSFVYQGIARGVGLEKLQTLHELILGDLYPDMTFFLDVPVKEGLKRAQNRSQKTDRFEEMGTKFHQHVRDGYHKLVQNSERIHVIDATQSPQIVHNRIVNLLERSAWIKSASSLASYQSSYSDSTSKHGKR